MADHPRNQRIPAHIESISTRAEPDTERLVSTMLRHCWPGGEGDRMEPGALEWVRRWGPRHVGVLPPACACRVGRCRVCNWPSRVDRSSSSLSASNLRPIGTDGHVAGFRWARTPTRARGPLGAWRPSPPPPSDPLEHGRQAGLPSRRRHAWRGTGRGSHRLLLGGHHRGL